MCKTLFDSSVTFLLSSAELQAEGRSEDLESFPMERHMATQTPPIPGFREVQSQKNAE
jgi:hypothetical protein